MIPRFYLSKADLAELLAPDVIPCRRERSVILLERCPVCGEWLPEGSRALGQCRACEVWLSVPSRQPTAIARAA